jgi:hypothetical protein
MFMPAPKLVNTVPAPISNGAAGGGGLLAKYKPVAVTTDQTCVLGAFTLIVSLNWPFVRLVALFLHTHGSEMEIPQLNENTDTEPFIVIEQLVETSVPITV